MRYTPFNKTINETSEQIWVFLEVSSEGAIEIYNYNRGKSRFVEKFNDVAKSLS